MPYNLNTRTEPCTVCFGVANILKKEFNVGTIVDCARCGDFEVGFETARQLELPYQNLKKRALASHIIRKTQAPNKRSRLTLEFFESLGNHLLPTPAEAMDNLVIWFAEQADGRPGARPTLTYTDPALLGKIGVVASDDIEWIVTNLATQALLEGGRASSADGPGVFRGGLTARGWDKFEELKRAYSSSNYAFFARQFSNADLDHVFDECLRKSVQETGYELRMVTQRAGLVDAVIEDEIRRCRFLIADLSDDNAGAYWEAGFAEGLGKPVIYICRANKADGSPMTTHFDANHRHTVKWDLASLDKTAIQLKAVIRNTLLGDAKQTD
jgi:nucleoside 2-deoxyribosyltransferase